MRAAGKKLLFTPLLFAFAFSAAACGKKGSPRAPELSIPAAIRDLSAEAREAAIQLSWSRPTRYVDGRELRDLAAFVVFRREVPAACPDCPVPYRELATVVVDDQEKFIKKRRFAFVDREVKPRAVYRYRVFSRLGDGGLSEPSNEVEIAWRP
jgi:hypothetical protein